MCRICPVLRNGGRGGGSSKEGGACTVRVMPGEQLGLIDVRVPVGVDHGEDLRQPRPHLRGQTPPSPTRRSTVLTGVACQCAWCRHSHPGAACGTHMPPRQSDMRRNQDEEVTIVLGTNQMGCCGHCPVFLIVTGDSSCMVRVRVYRLRSKRIALGRSEVAANGHSS